MTPATPFLLDSIIQWLAGYLKSNSIENVVILNDNTKNYYVNEFLLRKAAGKYNKFWIQVRDGASDDVVFMSEVHKELEVTNKRSCIVGNVDYTDGKYLRRYKKYGFGSCDIFPLFDLYKSTVYQIFDENVTAENLSLVKDQTPFDVYEFVLRANLFSHKGIIESEKAPVHHPRWFTFTLEQKKACGEMYNRNIVTKHKSLEHKPYFSEGKRL